MSEDFKPPARIVNSEALERKLARDPRCRICKARRATDPHHVVLKSQRGDDVEDNIVPLDRTCHRIYHDGRGRIDLTREETAYLFFKLGVDAGEIYAERRRLNLNRNPTKGAKT